MRELTRLIPQMMPYYRQGGERPVYPLARRIPIFDRRFAFAPLLGRTLPFRDSSLLVASKDKHEPKT